MTRRFHLVLIGAALALALPLGAGGVSAAQTPASPEKVSAMTVYAIIYRPGPAWRPDVPMSEQGLRDHFFYLRRIDAEGRIALAGPVGEDGGLILLRAESKADADAFVAADPAVVAGLFVGEPRPFVPRFVGRDTLEPVAP